VGVVDPGDGAVGTGVGLDGGELPVRVAAAGIAVEGEEREGTG
jgi:hypothetical protein